MRDSDLFLSGAQSQLAKAICTSVGVALLLWYRPALAWVLVLGWCVAGVWIAVHSYRAAMKVVAISARRKSEIVITEVKPC